MHRQSGKSGAVAPLSPFNRLKARRVIYELMLMMAIAGVAHEFVLNAKAKLSTQNIASGQRVNIASQ
jgi:hypothetical protein